MRAGDSPTNSAGCTLVLFILPISIRLTCTHVHCFPEWTEAPGNVKCPTMLTPETSQSSAYIVSNLTLDRNNKISPASLVFPNRPTLYFIGLRMESYDGLKSALGGTGHRKLNWSRVIKAPAFWKPGFGMVMVLGLSGSSMTLTIDV